MARVYATRRFHVRLPDGTLVCGAEGFVAEWDTVPGWAWAARAARLPGMTAVLELGYRMFLLVRPIMSRIATWLGAQPGNQETRRN